MLQFAARRKFAARAGGVVTAAAVLITGLSATEASAASGVWDRVAQCESGGNWKINTGNGYKGGLQFTSSTWRAYGGGQYAASAHNASKEQQIAVAKRVLAGQGPGAWPVCSRKAGLTRSNGGAASTAAAATAPKKAASSQAAPKAVAKKTVTKKTVTKSSATKTSATKSSATKQSNAAGRTAYKISKKYVNGRYLNVKTATNSTDGHWHAFYKTVNGKKVWKKVWVAN